jgi:hypothetical protein
VVEKLILPFQSQFCSVDFPLDVCALVLSTTETILGAQLKCPWEPLAGNADQDGVFLLSDLASLLPELRLWWATVRQRSVVMSQEAIALAENDFVNLRQVDSRLTAEDFHSWLAVGRLVAVACGELQITAAHWSTMRVLEKRRMNRRFPRAPNAAAFNNIPPIFQSSPNTVATGM